MAKKRDAGGGGKQRRRELAELERQLDSLMATEQRLSAKLARTQEKVRAVKDRIRELGGPEAETAAAGARSEVATAATAAALGPAVMAYCLRERRRVELADGMPLTLRNGRAAFAGTCPSCGVRIVSLAARQA